MNRPSPIERTLGLATFLLFACSSDGDSIAYMPDEVPSGRCNTDEQADDPECADTTGTTGVTTDTEDAPGSPCEDGSGCAEGFVCSAPFTNGERGEFACVEVCIGHMDELRWCADASACCHPDATCTSRGYCVEPSSGTDSDSDTGTDSDSDSDSGTDTDTDTE